MGATKPPVEITGAWLRRIGDEAQMLLEIDGEWRLVCIEQIHGTFSHIVEQAGMRRAPVDPVTLNA